MKRATSNTTLTDPHAIQPSTYATHLQTLISIIVACNDHFNIRDRMKAAMRLVGFRCAISLCFKPLQCPVYQYSSESSQKIRKQLLPYEQRFHEVAPELRSKETFLNVIDNFCKKQVHARGHVEFINSALKYMREYGLEKDLDIYKSLLNIFPKGPMIPQNVFQRSFLYYPQQQICCINLLDEMEWFGVQPDKEIHDLVVNAFGEWNYATKKVKRMLYWMPKLKHSNAYLDRRKIEGKKLGPIDLGVLALKMISRDPGTRITVVGTSGTELDESDRWLLSAQSRLQSKLLQGLEKNTTLYVDGPNKVYLMDNCVEYVGLLSDPKAQYYEKYKEDDFDEDFENWKSEWDGGHKNCSRHNIHEQQHETILALSVFGKVCRETAIAWIIHLQETNPSLHNAQVLFRTKQAKETLLTQLS
uniref:Evolutionarily conserved signaling intermediate in Toll pathway, mitochondrial n=1 Tax=Setaria digitata TaxID=48799 RepID=A0A915PLN6_9BILA